MADPYTALLARYNAWANERLYEACAGLSDGEYRVKRRSFFGSIHATLNHILVGDRLWMSRIERAPLAYALNQILFEDFAELRTARRAQDAAFIRLVDGLPADRLDQPLDYANTKGERFATPLRLVIGHIVNHQTHHRGQVHDMLSQTPVPPPELDLIFFVRLGAAG
ncbi:MAG TPA: DinB family protein [Stellaceae bacterium]|nr:DinB family protein [Stellaceae bacterium]